MCSTFGRMITILIERKQLSQVWINSYLQCLLRQRVIGYDWLGIATKEPWLTKRWYDLKGDGKWRLSDGFTDRMLQV